MRVKSSNRAGFITGNLSEDHTRCCGAHDKCRIRVHVDWSRSIIETMVDVSDIEPCRPTKKNSTIAQIRGLQGMPTRILTAKSVPRQVGRGITVCEPTNERRTWDMDAWQLTYVERLSDGP